MFTSFKKLFRLSQPSNPTKTTEAQPEASLSRPEACPIKPETSIVIQEASKPTPLENPQSQPKKKLFRWLRRDPSKALPYLPPELHLRIIELAEGKQLVALSAVCRLWRNFISQSKRRKESLYKQLNCIGLNESYPMQYLGYSECTWDCRNNFKHPLPRMHAIFNEMHTFVRDNDGKWCLRRVKPYAPKKGYPDRPEEWGDNRVILGDKIDYSAWKDDRLMIPKEGLAYYTQVYTRGILYSDGKARGAASYRQYIGRYSDGRYTANCRQYIGIKKYMTVGDFIDGITTAVNLAFPKVTDDLSPGGGNLQSKCNYVKLCSELKIKNHGPQAIIFDFWLNSGEYELLEGPISRRIL